MAMPQPPPSPHRPPSVDILPSALGSCSPLHQPKDSHSFCTPAPLATSSLNLSPTPSKNKPTMTTAFTEQSQARTSKDQQHQHQQQQQQHFNPSIVNGLGANTSSISLNSWSPYSASYDQACAPKQDGQYGTSYGTGYPSPVPFDDAPPDFNYQMPNNSLPYSMNSSLMYPLGSDPSCPRSLQSAHPPSAFHIEPPKFSPDGLDSADQNTSSNQLLQFNSEYDTQCASGVVKVEGSVYDGCSPYGSVPGTRDSTPHDEIKTAVMTPGTVKNEDDGSLDKTEPYAQLIYRALLEAPGHTMILRDIYNWFIQNTDKAADKETKGWQNSIRHNLSMNGAFEKVDQPCEEARRGFMWRLTDEAIREGVKSTTRYRSKQPNKRGHRSHNPLPQRQASGAKGGVASRRSAKRRSQRTADAYGGHHLNHQHRLDPYTMCRSVPAGYDHNVGFEANNAVDIPYPFSPAPSSYYGSEMDFSPSTPETNFGAPLMPSGMEMNMTPYVGSPLAQSPLSQDGSSLPYNDAYVMHQDPSEPLFYATDGSLSPEASEPTTPPDAQMDCYSELSSSMDHPFYFDDISNTYQE